MSRRWSLSRRLALWFTVAVGALAAAVATVGAAVLSRAAEGELELLAIEELHELDLVWPTTDGSFEAFEAVTSAFSQQHSSTPFAWRVRRRADGAPWGEFGSTALLERLPAEWAPSGRTRAVDESVRTRCEAVDPDLLVELAIDGSTPLRVSGHYGLIVLMLGAIATAAALVLGVFLGRRVGQLLGGVAREVRARGRGTADAPLDTAGLPDEIREVAEALSETLTRIDRDAERTRMLTTGLAHELRAPLQNLLGEAEVTLLRDREPREYRRALESQLEELRDLVRVTDNLVLLCSPRSLAPAELERFDLEQELGLRLGRERTAAARRDVHLRFLRRGDPELVGDREALVLALRNLVSNAIEWSPEGSEVSLLLESDDGALVVTVDDAGPGVPQAERERIFDAFYSGRARSGRRAGYGLGLALARGAVHEQGGSIEVGDAPEGGARFRVTLPREGPGQAAARGE